VPGHDVEGNAVERDDAAEANGDILDAQQGLRSHGSGQSSSYDGLYLHSS